jgi:hypothetical protein
MVWFVPNPEVTRPELNLRAGLPQRPLVGYVKPDFGLQIIDRVIPDDGHAEFEWPVAIFTTSFESGCRWLSDNEDRTATPTSVPPDITAKTSSEIKRSFILKVSPPVSYSPSGLSVPEPS